MCKMLNISRSYYYKLVKLKFTVKDNETKYVNERIEIIYNSSNKMYGSRKISACLAKEGIYFSTYKTLKLMKINGLSSLYNNKKRYQPYDVKEAYKVIEISDKVEQKFTTDCERKILTSDLTYIPFRTSFIYICFVVDLYNREILAHGVKQ